MKEITVKPITLTDKYSAGGICPTTFGRKRLMNNSGALLGKIKNFIGFGGDDYMDYEDDYEENELPEEEPAERKKSKTAFSRRDKVVSLNGSSTAQTKIVVIKPKCFNNSAEVTHELRQRHMVILNVGALDPDEARRVVDFVSGTVYGMDGDMQKVTGGIFIAAPSQVEIKGEVSEDKGAGFGWDMF